MNVVATSPERPSIAALFRAGAITVVVATIATVAAALALRAILGIDPAFQPLQPASVAFFTVLQVGIGMVVHAVIARRVGRPRRTESRLPVELRLQRSPPRANQRIRVWRPPGVSPRLPIPPGGRRARFRSGGDAAGPPRLAHLRLVHGAFRHDGGF